jgi:hypothetical protein
MTRQLGDDLADALVAVARDRPGRRQNIVVDGNCRAHHGPRMCIMHHASCIRILVMSRAEVEAGQKPEALVE